MRSFLTTAAFCLVSCAARPPAGPHNQPLGLVNRTAGAPERCVLIQPAESLRVSQSDPHALLYGNGHTIWVNHLGPGCGFHAGDTLITEPIGSSHCRGDLVRSFDSFTRVAGPACRLGDFVPYRH